MQQAYLFDYIQPELPAFNTNIFKLASQNYLCSHVHRAAEVTEQLVSNEQNRLEQIQKALQKMKKQPKASVANLATDDLNQNKLDYFLFSQQVDTLCSQVEDIGIPQQQ